MLIIDLKCIQLTSVHQSQGEGGYGDGDDEDGNGDNDDDGDDDDDYDDDEDDGDDDDDEDDEDGYVQLGWRRPDNGGVMASVLRTAIISICGLFKNVVA